MPHNIQTAALLQQWLKQGVTQSAALQLAELYEHYKNQPPLDWQSVLPLNTQDNLGYNQLSSVTTAEKKKLLGQVAVVKLNGGLGTSMGCEFPKSLIPVHQKHSFLNLHIQQIEYLTQTYQHQPPLLLMNSFATHPATLQALQQHPKKIQVGCLQQSQLPRLEANSLQALDPKIHQASAFYPPGHGDFFKTFFNSHFLDLWIQQGIKYLFVSNIDNLCATIDFKILNYLEQSQCPFLQEVTLKTPADQKGGTLVRIAGQDSLKLLEIAEVPQQHLAEFCSVSKFPTFNTNNLWLNLNALKQKSTQKLKLDVLLNPKQVGEVSVWQLETAIGSAVQCFSGSQTVQVHRNRFFPTKTTNDLLLLQSDLFEFNNGFAQLHPQHSWQNLPSIQLSADFKNLKDYQQHFVEIPCMLELEQLVVEGLVRFGKNVRLKGRVKLTGHPQPLQLENQQLENQQIHS